MIFRRTIQRFFFIGKPFTFCILGFARKLKPSVRPVENLDDPYRLVSAADCLLMTFASVLESTQLWRKGREFTVAYLLGDKYKDEAERSTGDLQLDSTRLPSIPFACGGQDWRDDLSLGNVSPLM